MRPIDASAEESVIETLQRTGPCYLDDLVIQFPYFSWSEVFIAVDRMSRDGRLFLRRLARSTYYAALPSWHDVTSFTLSSEGGAIMIPLTARFCVGCGQVLDDLQSSDSRPCWIAPHAYREKYGFMFTDLHLIGDACPRCAHVMTIGRRESLSETKSGPN